MLPVKKTKSRLAAAATKATPKSGPAYTTTYGRATAGASMAALDEAWQAIEREVEAMFAQIDSNLEIATNHLAHA